MPAVHTVPVQNNVSVSRGVLRRGRAGMAPLPVTPAVNRTHGVCCGITACWAKAILSGRRYGAAQGGLAQRQGALAQAVGQRTAGTVGRFALADFAEFIVDTQNLQYSDAIASRELMTGLDWITGQPPAVWMILMSGNPAGHAMGAQVTATHYYFFDPNGGEWRWPLAEKWAFILDVEIFILESYGNLNARHVAFAPLESAL